MCGNSSREALRALWKDLPTEESLSPRRSWKRCPENDTFGAKSIIVGVEIISVTARVSSELTAEIADNAKKSMKISVNSPFSAANTALDCAVTLGTSGVMLSSL